MGRLFLMSEVPLYHFRAKQEQLETFERLSPESPGQNLAMTVLHVPYSAVPVYQARVHVAAPVPRRESVCV